MSYYLIHVQGGTDLTAFEFETREARAAFRAKYGDDENEEGYRRSIDERQPIPGTFDHYDDHESDAWIDAEGTLREISGTAPMTQDDIYEAEIAEQGR